jgi:hypothetical protein
LQNFFCLIEKPVERIETEEILQPKITYVDEVVEVPEIIERIVEKVRPDHLN